MKRQGDNASGEECFSATKKARTRASSSWVLLPVEIRLMILEEISCQIHHGWTSSVAIYMICRHRHHQVLQRYIVKTRPSLELTKTHHTQAFNHR